MGFSYSSITWIVANLVAYGFMYHFDDISLVTDSQMSHFCFGTSIVSTYIQIILDYNFPKYNTATYYIFGGEENEERHQVQQTVLLFLLLCCLSLQEDVQITIFAI